MGIIPGSEGSLHEQRELKSVGAEAMRYPRTFKVTNLLTEDIHWERARHVWMLWSLLWIPGVLGHRRVIDSERVDMVMEPVKDHATSTTIDNNNTSTPCISQGCSSNVGCQRRLCW